MRTYRLTWIASMALLGLVVLRLTRLLRPTEAGIPWPLVVILGSVVGGFVTWGAASARVRTLWMVALNVGLFGVFVFFYVGGDIAQSALPPLDVIGDLRHEMGDALNVFRFSAPPVSPLVGLVASIAGVLWALTALSVWGMSHNNPYLGVVPPIVFYLQLAVIDPQDAAWEWSVALLALVGFGLVAISTDQRAGGGHAGRGLQAARIRGFAVAFLSIVVVTSGAVAMSSAVDSEVPSGGLLDWRSQAGSGGGFGGSISYNPFLQIRRGLVSNSTAPVFSATITGENTDDLYWRLLTMDTFRMGPGGDWWFASKAELDNLEDTNWEKAEFASRGPTDDVSAEVTIAQLGQDLLPAPYSPTSLKSSERLINNSGRINPQDGSIKIDGVTRSGMTYRVDAAIPRPDVAVLAGTPEGSLSPLFAAAAREGNFQSAPLPALWLELSDDEFKRYTALPDDFPPSITKLASEVTFGVETDYERGLALENFLRSPENGFRYAIDIPPNEQNTGLEEWLLDDTLGSGYRTGYCEQFALSMGVMARSLGIPTRGVMGFTPGQRASSGDVVVLDKNAHAWVQLWMPSQGWVRFDPTPRSDGVNPSTSGEIADLDRYLDLVAAEAQATIDDAEPDPGPSPGPRGLDPGPRTTPPSPSITSQDGFQLSSWALRATASSLLIGVAVAAVPIVKRRRRRFRMRRLSDGDINAAWAEMIDYLIDSGFRVDPAATPKELATATDEAMRPLASAYSESTYGPQASMPAAAVETATASLTATVESLRGRMTRWEKTRQRYRVKSLLPDWLKRTK